MDPKLLVRHQKSSRPQLTTTDITNRTIAKRRSPRIQLKASVALSGEDRLKCFFSMPARATNLNKHGAAIHLIRDLLVGSIVVVQNKRGTQLTARIVAQLSATQGMSTYGIEFVERDGRASNFWGTRITYNSTYPTQGYAASLGVLGPDANPCTPSSTNACLVDSRLATGVKSGYNFAATGGAPQNGANTNYYTMAVPITVNQTGIRSFCSIADAVVRVQPTGAPIGTPFACAALSPLNQ